jgi:hypothetical protein
MSFVAGRVLGQQIADVLGIDTKTMTKMTIEMNADGPAYVIVEAIMFGEQDELIETLSRYRLVEDHDG